MAKGLIIVESPAKASTISKFLKNKFNVKASMGHIRDLPAHDLGVDVENNFAPSYVTDKKKSKIISELREAAKNSDAIYLASDHDREGEAIAWHLSKLLEKELGDKPLYRIVFNEITSKAINSAISEPGQIDMSKVDAQQARRILDRVVGYSISPLLWKVIAKDLSAGRVQSVALRLICEREAEIKAFVPKEFWRIEADFWRDDLPKFKASLEKYNGKKLEIKNDEEATKLTTELQKQTAVLSEIKRRTRNVDPPAPFITSTLQQEASKIMSFQAQRTMKIAQQLYEGIDIGGESTGLITYMRTDSTRTSSEANETAKQLIGERFGADYINSSTRMYKNKQSAQDAHEAIRPTDPFRTPESLSPYLSREQLKLYTLIWQRFIATQMKAVKVLGTTARITVGEAEFAASGNQISFDGFLKCYNHVNIPLGEKIHKDYVKSDELMHDALRKTQHFTTPPSRFTEASLIKELEAKGIGRPSTYAAIIGTIRNRKYAVMEKKSFVATPLGMDVNGFLVGKFDSLFNVKFTAQMEDKLDEVEYGKVVWHKLVKEYYDDMKELIDKVDVKKEKEAMIQETGIKCELCGKGEMVVKRGRSGEFLSCNRYPECKNSKSFKRDAEGKIEIVVPKVLDEKCPKCGNPLVERNGKYGAFIACSNYPKCKYSRPKTLGIACPECGTGEVTARRSKKGSPFYSCNRYPECKWISNYKPVPQACPNCANPYMEERYNKDKGTFMQCPKCKHVME
ncbi:MAG: type I DNA topoisomerase [Candidatus Cloacimonetes bacterium]|nr:type I DNA topoisomerase [Candidatus Cloacimonadota bacterium]MCB5254112.1 type I DNA topoisomerase [Candidatus Cloacimonadota bacterium]MCK9177699.1 type I DNA topoisomerase [Candidatus Cloacimonadota bacterium]MCK9241672.1 type I DNA topoisomerase [Candidatus Cloacimonadota bacterium]MDD3103127.1 type I DNA topoisomerase [Candidatus Cloacimonadota bacterium]